MFKKCIDDKEDFDFSLQKPRSTSLSDETRYFLQPTRHVENGQERTVWRERGV